MPGNKAGLILCLCPFLTGPAETQAKNSVFYLNMRFDSAVFTPSRHLCLARFSRVVRALAHQVRSPVGRGQTLLALTHLLGLLGIDDHA